MSNTPASPDPGRDDTSRAAGFASGKPLDVAPGCLVLGQFAEDAARDDDRYPGASDDELLGVVCAWDRVEAYVAARKHAAVAEVDPPPPGARRGGGRGERDARGVG